MKDNEPKVALITGANRGIGLQTARELARLGIFTLLGARDSAKGETAAASLRAEGLRAEAVRLDMEDRSTFGAVSHHLESRYGKLDILVSNAGLRDEGSAGRGDVPMPNHTSSVPMASLRHTFDVNFFAVIELTQRLLPLIRKSPAGRIVNVSSILGSLTVQLDRTSRIYDRKFFAYDASKTALNAFTVHLAHELRDTPIKVNSAHPGWVRTEMGGPDALLDVSEGAKTSVWLATLPADGPSGGYFYLQEPLPW